MASEPLLRPLEDPCVALFDVDKLGSAHLKAAAVTGASASEATNFAIHLQRYEGEGLSVLHLSRLLT